MPITHPPPILRILIVDAGEEHRELMIAAVRRGADAAGVPIEVVGYEHPTDALVDLPETGPIAVLCDHRLGQTIGLEWVPHFVRTAPGPVILVTSQSDLRLASDAFRLGALDLVEKAEALDDPGRLFSTITDALARFELAETNRHLAQRLRRANEELRRKNAVLSEVSATAQRFVEDVAHEYRTPLTVIREFASLMQDQVGGPVQEAHEEFLQHIMGAVHDLSGLVDDFLDSGRIRAESLRMDRRVTALGPVIQRLTPELEERGRSRTIRLTIGSMDGLPPILADEQRLQRQIVNLLLNAVKRSEPDDPVRIEAREVGDHVEIRVRDAGRAPTPDERSRLNHVLSHPHDTPPTDGLVFGLGLAVVRDLSVLGLGRARVEAGDDGTTDFVFSVPIARPASVVRAWLDIPQVLGASGEIAAVEVEVEASDLSGQDPTATVAKLAPPWFLVTGTAIAGRVLVLAPAAALAAWAEDRCASGSGSGSADPDTTRLAVLTRSSWPPADVVAAIADRVQLDLRGLRGATGQPRSTKVLNRG